MIDKKIAFIGVGNMAGSIITPAIATSENSDALPVISPDNLYLCDLDHTKTERFTRLGAHVSETPVEALKVADYIFFSVKPQNFPEVLASLSENCDADTLKKKLYITIGAGISTDYISVMLNKNSKKQINISVVRAMPNTPMLVGMGVAALCRNSFVSDEDYAAASLLFSAAGRVFDIDESDMNSIISVTSSSPAYVFKFIKDIKDGAKAQGLNYSDKMLLDIISDMVIGSAFMLKASDKTPEELIKIVTSKGGTTEQALLELDRYNFDDAIISAMKKCTERAEALGKTDK